jgi:hypothetical protein
MAAAGPVIKWGPLVAVSGLTTLICTRGVLYNDLAREVLLPRSPGVHTSNHCTIKQTSTSPGRDREEYANICVISGLILGAQPRCEAVPQYDAILGSAIDPKRKNRRS